MQSESVSAQRGRCPQHPQCPHLGPGPWETWSPLGLTSRLTCEPLDAARDPVPEVPARVCPPAPHPGHGQQARVTPRQVGCACVSGLCPPSNSLNWGGGAGRTPSSCSQPWGREAGPSLPQGLPGASSFSHRGCFSVLRHVSRHVLGRGCCPRPGVGGGVFSRPVFSRFHPAPCPPAPSPGHFLDWGGPSPSP